jgi:hypothetical protein
VPLLAAPYCSRVPGAFGRGLLARDLQKQIHFAATSLNIIRDGATTVTVMDLIFSSARASSSSSSSSSPSACLLFFWGIAQGAVSVHGDGAEIDRPPVSCAYRHSPSPAASSRGLRAIVVKVDASSPPRPHFLGRFIVRLLLWLLLLPLSLLFISPDFSPFPDSSLSKYPSWSGTATEIVHIQKEAQEKRMAKSSKRQASTLFRDSAVIMRRNLLRTLFVRFSATPCFVAASSSSSSPSPSLLERR